MIKNKDPYVYSGTSTLKNKFNLVDFNAASKLENELSFYRMRKLAVNHELVKGDFDYQHLQDIHKNIFQDMYDWAGKPRTIGIRKREPLLNNLSIPYPDPNNPYPPEKLDARAQYAFKDLKEDNNLKNLDEKQFISKLAKHLTEIWEVHPFRDGNQG